MAESGVALRSFLFGEQVGRYSSNGVVAVERQEAVGEFYLLQFYTVVVRRKYTDVSEEHILCVFVRKSRCLSSEYKALYPRR
jgi:hypothetical protein